MCSSEGEHSRGQISAFMILPYLSLVSLRPVMYIHYNTEDTILYSFIKPKLQNQKKYKIVSAKTT